MRELLRGKQVALLVKGNIDSKSASEVDQSRDITLIIFCQVMQAIVWYRVVTILMLSHSLFHSLVPSGGDILFSYGHCTLTVSLPHSIPAISKVSYYLNSLV